MVLNKRIFYGFVLLIIPFLFFINVSSFAREIKKEKNIEDIFLSNLEKNLGISIVYAKKRGSIFTGFTFENVVIYKEKKDILDIKKVRWAPLLKNIRNPLSIFKSFSISFINPTLHIYSQRDGSSYTDIAIYQDFFRSIKEYKVNIEIKKGIIEIPNYPFVFLDGTFLWDGLLHFRDVKARIGEGRLEFKGSLDPFFQNKKARLNVVGIKMPSPVPYYYKGNADFKVSIFSENENMGISGNLELEGGTIFIREGGGSEHFWLNPYLDIVVKLSKNVKIKGGIYYELEGKGLFKVGSSLKIPKLVGKFFVDSGKILFGSRYFKVVDGTVEFNDFTFLDPVLSINAQGEVDGIKIFAHIGSFSSKPKVALTSIPPFSQDELSSLIMLGKRIEDYKRENFNEFLTSESLNIAFRSLSLSFMDSLNEIGRKYLGLDTFSLEPSFEVYHEDTIRTKWSLRIGKFVGKDFYIKYERVLTPYVDDVFGFEFYPIKGFYFDFSIDKKSNIQVELIYEYTF